MVDVKKLEITATRRKISFFILGIIGMVVLASGSLFLGFYESIIKLFLRRELVLEPGKQFFEIWKEIPLPVYQKIYFFNITNPEAFSEHGNKPILQELGPYVYKGKWRKDNMEWDKENGTVTYKDVKEYTFAPELSNGSEDDLIYTVNGPLLAVINYVEQAYFPFSWMKDFAVNQVNGISNAYNETLLVHKTVGEMVYNGYYEPMLEELVELAETVITLPLKLINNTFGILHERKHIGDGVFTIQSGANGIENYAAIESWNNQTSVDWWHDEYCNQINGTDGVQFRPGVTRNDILYFFNPNLCRSVSIKYERDVTVHGIKTLRFTMPEDSMAAPAINPDNHCFCEGNGCEISGIIPINCKKGAPYVLSNPHFFEADPELQTSLVGLNPSADKHRTYFDIEPRTGFVLNAAVKLQLNGVVKRLPAYTHLQNVVDCIVPVIWISEGATLDTFFANDYKSRVQTPLVVFKALCIAAVALGAIWTISAVCFMFCIKGKVQPLNLTNSLLMNTLQSVYTSVALWPPTEEEVKEASQNYKYSS